MLLKVRTSFITRFILFLALFVGISDSVVILSVQAAIPAHVNDISMDGVTIPEGNTICVSVDPNNIQGNGYSLLSSISADGRFVAFQSGATNLVAGDTNGADDIFLYDLQNGITSRISVDTDAVQGNNSSGYPFISPSGRYITYASSATNLVPNDTNDMVDIFVYDRQTGTTNRVSIDSNGQQANNNSSNSTISSDGHYVAFTSSASNLVQGDTNEADDIFLHDMQTGMTTRVSVDSGGAQANLYSDYQTISDDGRFVAFHSSATNLIQGDTNGTQDIFVYDRQTGTTKLVSVGYNGTQANNQSLYPFISSDGHYVMFHSSATNLVSGDTNAKTDIFKYDTWTGTTMRVSVSSTGEQANGTSANSSITPDGRYITFYSSATNLVPNDTNGVSDVFVHDVQTGITTRVSINSNGVQTNGNSQFPSISSDGSLITFTSYATNLVQGDTNSASDIFVHRNNFQATPVATATPMVTSTPIVTSTNTPSISPTPTGTPTLVNTPTFTSTNTTTSIPTLIFSPTPISLGNIGRISVNSLGAEANGSSTGASISLSGRYVGFISNANNLVSGDTNGTYDCFLHDRQTGETKRVSISTNGGQANNSSYYPSISSDGHYVTFYSYATNLVPGDTNGQTDIFLYDVFLDATTRISVNSNGVQANNSSVFPSISADGRFVVFRSSATNLVPGDTNGKDDIFLYSIQTSTITRVSVNSAGEQANQDSYDSDISTDGRYITYYSFATNLAPNDTNGVDDVFLYDQQTGMTTLASVSSSGTQANNQSYNPSISGNGRFIAFASYATNLTNNINTPINIFVRDLQTGIVTLVSVSSDGTPANGRSYGPFISSDGRYVTFTSYATNLIASDTNGASDAFVHDMQTGVTLRVSIGPNDTPSNNESSSFSISEDGQYVVFNSSASNLVAGDTNLQSDIFVYRQQISPSPVFTSTVIPTYTFTGTPLSPTMTQTLIVTSTPTATAVPTNTPSPIPTKTYTPTPIPTLVISPTPISSGNTVRISVDSSGSQGSGYSSESSMSADGRYIAFTSGAANLVPGDTNGQGDIFLHDMLTGTRTRVSVDSNGLQTNNSSYSPFISANGRYVVFTSDAINLVSTDTNGVSDIFVHDTQTGTTSRISVDSNGLQANGGSSFPSISADGRFIVFQSSAANLVPGDTNGQTDVFVRDTQTGTTTRVSVDSSGMQANNESYGSSISADARYVSFDSMATNLVTGDTNGKRDIFVYDRQTGITTRVSVDSSGIQGNDESHASLLSEDGQYVVFESGASNLVSGDTNGTYDVFLHDRQTGTTTRVSLDTNGVQGNGFSGNSFITPNGNRVVFESSATNLVTNDTNAISDIFVRDLQTGQTTRVSVASNGTQQGNATCSFICYSFKLSASEDGTYITFTSYASNLVPNDTNATPDVFVHRMDIASLPTATATVLPTTAPTNTSTVAPSNTPVTPTVTLTPSNTPVTPTVTLTPSNTPATPTVTFSPVWTPTLVTTPTKSSTPLPTFTPSRPYLRSEIVAPASILSLSGTTSGPSSSLSLFDQTGTADDPAAYVTFQTPKGAYTGYQTFTLPEGAQPNLVSTMLLQVNFKAPATSQIWTWSVYDWDSGMWIKIGDSIGAKPNEWQTLTFRIRQPRRSISSAGEIRIQLRSNNTNGDAKIDYEGLHITYLSVPAANTPMAPVHGSGRPGTSSVHNTQRP